MSHEVCFAVTDLVGLFSEGGAGVVVLVQQVEQPGHRHRKGAGPVTQGLCVTAVTRRGVTQSTTRVCLLRRIDRRQIRYKIFDDAASLMND